MSLGLSILEPPRNTNNHVLMVNAFFLLSSPLCSHGSLQTELQNPNGETFLSKLTLAALEDIGYIVDPSKVRNYETFVDARAQSIGGSERCIVRSNLGIA